MKNIIFASLLLLNYNCFSQVFWIKDYDVASQVAIDENKFIVMDFWATWCGPCVEMDKKMWSDSKINPLAKNFVALKIDVDHNRELALKYNATSIPKVIIIDPAGNIVWQQVGFSTPSPYLSTFKEIPNSTLSKEALKKEINSSGDENSWNSIAIAYQEMGKKVNSTRLANGFLNLSDQYFHSVQKETSNNKVIEETKLNIVLNDAYRGKTKKALKQLAKLGNNDSDLKNYIFAYCYKCEGKIDEMKRYKELIKNPALVSKLD